MNQGIAFARTLRALEADDFRWSKLGLLAAVVGLVGWSWWMFAGRVAQYESTDNVRIESGRVIAYFPPETAQRIRAGQPAILNIGGKAFQARVQSTAFDGAKLVLTNPPSAIALSSSASAEIEIARVSPAAIAFQSLTRGNR